MEQLPSALAVSNILRVYKDILDIYTSHLITERKIDVNDIVPPAYVRIRAQC